MLRKKTVFVELLYGEMKLLRDNKEAFLGQQLLVA